ncbi:MAG: septum formation protein Maf, partial [Candidatus Moranbacteria bacterium GW2011_GWA2_39_41]
MRKIILASKSPRRKFLLKQIGLDFEIHESEYEEDMTDMNDPHELVKFLSLNKARDVARYYEDAIIIGADTFRDTSFKNLMMSPFDFSNKKPRILTINLSNIK